MNSNINIETSDLGDFIEVSISYDQAGLAMEVKFDLGNDEAKALTGEIDLLKEALDDFTYKHWHKEMSEEIHKHGG